MDVHKIKNTAFAASALLLAASGALAVCAADASASAASPSVIIKSAEVVSARYVDAKCGISVYGNTASVSLGTFTQPGAYAQIKTEIVNNGSAAAVLKGVRQLTPEIDGIKTDYPSIDIESEELLPGEICTIDITVSCSADYSSEILDIQNAEFEFELIYTADETTSAEKFAAESTAATRSASEYIKNDSSSDSPKTGLCNGIQTALAAVAAAALTVTFWIAVKDKREDR